MKFFKRKQAEDEEQQHLTNASKPREWCSIGAFVNYSITVIFIAIFLSCIVVIGTIGTIQNDLHQHNAFVNNSRSCYMYATCDNNPNKSLKCLFAPTKNHACDGTMVAYGFIAVLAIGFFISLIIKAVLNHR